MPIRASWTLLSLCLLVLTLASLSTAFAEEPTPSLYERRLGILKGTSRGIVLYAPDAPTPPTAAAPNGHHVETAKDGKPSVANAPQASAISGFLNALPPPSGRSLDEARRLGAPGGGMPVSTANKASQTQAESVAKP